MAKDVSTADQVDRELAAAALEKRRKGQTPTSREMAALRRVEKQREETARWGHYETIPKKHWRSMSGRQQKVIDEQATRYTIPLLGPTIDLAAVVRWLHDFLARHKHLLARADDPELLAGDSPALEKLREEKYRLAQLERHAKEGELLPRDRVHELHVRLATILRRAGESLQKAYGPDAQGVLDEALDDFDREIQTLLAGDGEGNQTAE